MNSVSQPLSVSLHLFSFFPSLSVAFSVWLRVSLVSRSCSVVASVIDGAMCHRAGEKCSWKYIICNFSWVNIAGSLVKQRDKLFWERKCCLSFLKAGKKSFLQLLENVVLSRLSNNESTDEEAWANDGPYVVMPQLHLAPSARQIRPRKQEPFL